MEPYLYTVQQATQVLNMSRSKLYLYLQSGRIQSVKVGGSRRITKSAMEDFLHSLEAGY